MVTSRRSGSRLSVLQRAIVALQVVLMLASLVAPAAALAQEPSADASAPPTPVVSEEPSAEPTSEPTPEPTPEPTQAPTEAPTEAPTPTASPAYTPGGAPTIVSDLDDYPPGGLVTLTGSNWHSGESVRVFVNDDWGSTWSRTIDVIANGEGNISDQFNLPTWFVATYQVIATGSVSGVATWEFTDSNPGAIVVAAPTNVSVAQGSTANYGTLTQEAGGNSDACTTTFSVVAGGGTGLPVGATPNFGTNPLTTTGSNASTTFSVTTSSSTTPTGTYTFRVRGTYSVPSGGACQGNQSGTSKDSNLLTLVVTAGSLNTSTVAQSKTATYGNASVTLTATVTPASGPAVNAGTVTFTVKQGATTVGTATSGTLTSGNASASFSLAGVSAGSYTIEAAYSGGTGFNASDNSTQSPAPTLTVNKANQSISVTTAAPASATYGSTFSVAATASSGLAVAITSSGGCSGSGSGSATITVTSGTTACTVMYDQAGNGNYNSATQLTNSTTAVKKTLTVTANGKSKQFGAADPTFDVGYAGFAFSDTASSLGGVLVFTFAGISGTTYGPSTTVPSAVGTYSITPSGLTSANYSFSYVAGTYTIGKADQSITVTMAAPASATYGSAFNVTATASSGLPVTITTTGGCSGGDTDGSATITMTSGTTACTVLYDQAGNANYNAAPQITSSTTAVQKALTITATNQSKTYGTEFTFDETTPSTHFTVLGLVNDDTVESVTLASAGAAETAGVAGSPYAISVSAATGDGLGNYTISYVAGSLTVNKANTSVAITWNDTVYTGAPVPASATVTGPVAAENPLTSPAVTLEYFTGFSAGTPGTGTSAAPMLVGTYTVRASFAGTGNYNPSSAVKTITITTAFRVIGFDSPVDMTTIGNTRIYNSVKAGQTVPLKFRVFTLSGTEITSTTGIGAYFRNVTCASGQVDPVLLDTVSTNQKGVFRTGDRFHFNWAVPSGAGKCYQVVIQTVDGSTVMVGSTSGTPVHEAYFRTK